MADTYTEISESPTITSYRLTQRIHEGRTVKGVDVLVADSEEYGRMLFLDGELQSAAADEHIYHETLVHPVMSASLAGGEAGMVGASVLVVGGGEGATVREVARWPHVRRIDWVDYDEELVGLCEQHLRWAPDARGAQNVRFLGMDIGEALPLLGEYDVIILDLPDPDGDTGYLYSSQFWQDMQDHLRPGGRIVSHCGPVRPWGGVGDGYQRLLRDGPAGAVFYHQVIPSFQGEWGFLIWGGTVSQERVFVPMDLRVATADQVRRWMKLEKYWVEAVGS
jgi:spermidine synthase